MSEPTTNWTSGVPEGAVNGARAELYAALMAAQERIANALYQRGVRHEVVLDALDSVDERLSEDERREDLVFSALAIYVEALGGRLELRAVFDHQEIVVRSASERW